MNKKTIASFAVIFLFLFFFNTIAPMYFGDDYVYSFIWEGHSLYEPLSEHAVRVSSWKDLFTSQWLHYFTWSGRTVNHTLAQFFLWQGKKVFNVFNALAGTLLIAEIYWCSHKGVISLQSVKAGIVSWIFFLLWSFTPAFGTVFLWLDGACNYLWPIVFLTGFIIPYIKKYYYFSETIKQSKLFCLVMFVFGVISGWTNENTICWILLVLSLFLLTHKNKDGFEKWMIFGLMGLMTGYALLMFSPGNIVRLYAEQKGYSWLSWKRLKEQFSLLAFIVLYFQVFLWYFNLRSLFCLRKRNKDNLALEKEVMLVKILCVIAFGMAAVMVFSPGFPPRSGFPGTVFLIIVTGILLRLQNEYGILLIQEKAKKFLIYMGAIYFVMTTVVAFNHYYEMYLYADNIVASARQLKSEEVVLEVQPEKELSLATHVMSAYHVVGLGISEDEKEWKNVAFARYYGIKGIRMVKEKKDNNKNEHN